MEMTMGTELILENWFKDEDHYFRTLVHTVLTNEGHDDLLDSIDDIDWETDLGDRVFITFTDRTYFILRTWSTFDDDDNVYVDYTIFPYSVD